MENVIGPVLPPHLLKKASLENQDAELNDLSELNQNEQSISNLKSSDEIDVYGPALPPHLKQSQPSNSTIQGPTLPSDLQNCLLQDSDSEDDDVVGPVLEKPGRSYLSHKQLEARAQYLKRKLAEEESSGKQISKRESWMLELPPEKAVNLGLGPRQFRKRAGPDLSDRSDWTDTPEDRIRKQILGKDEKNQIDSSENLMKAAALQERDKVMEKMAESCKDEKRELSLLEMHQKKMKKKKKKEKKDRGDKPAERRPFDRNIDLQANRFDEAQKKSIFKKAQLLDTRFSSGESKFL